MILEAEEARRLARAILTDVVLYGSERALHDAAAMGEARDLFSARVSGSLQHIFEEERRARAERSGGQPQIHGSPMVTGASVSNGTGLRLGPLVAGALGFVMVVAIATAAFLVAR